MLVFHPFVRRAKPFVCCVRQAGFSFLFVLLLVLPRSGIAQTNSDEPQTVEVERRVFAGDKTPNEARKQALEEAQAEAIRQVVGTQVQMDRERVTIETGDDVVDRFSQIVRTGASGRVVDHEVLEEDRREIGGEVFQYLRIRATVQPEQGQMDPGFNVKLRLNDEDRVFVDRGARTENDEVIAEIEVTKDAYLTLFSVTPDTLQVIWPNSITSNTFVSANTTVQFPPKELRDAGIRLRVQVPDGKSQITERLVAVATKEKVPFRPVPEYQVKEGQLTTAQASVQALNRWLVEIPLDQRALATVTYDVTRSSE